MAENFNARIKNKRDTSANWTTNDPVILNGEIILVDTATGELRAKIGDGTKRYTELPFTDEAIKTLLNNKADADHTHDFDLDINVENGISEGSVQNVNSIAGGKGFKIVGQRTYSGGDSYNFGYMQNNGDGTGTCFMQSVAALAGLASGTSCTLLINNVTIDATIVAIDTIGVSITVSGVPTDLEGAAGTLILGGEAVEGVGIYTLSSVEGLEVGLAYSVRLSTSSYNAGTIIAISGNDVTVNGYTYIELETDADDSENFSIENYMTIVGRPDLGDTDVGFNAFASGENCIAQDRSTVSFGRDNKSIGQYGATFGRDNTAGYASMVSGRNNTADGTCLLVSGQNNKVDGSHNAVSGWENNVSGGSNVVSGSSNDVNGTGNSVVGYDNTVKASYTSVNGTANTITSNYGGVSGRGSKVSADLGSAEGHYTEVKAYAGHAEGGKTISAGNYSHAQNWECRANGEHSTATGSYTKANKKSTFTAGQYTVADSESQFVRGKFNISDAENKYADIVGNGTSDTARSNAYTLDWDGNGWFAGEVTVGADKDKLATESFVTEQLASVGGSDVETITVSSDWQNDGSLDNCFAWDDTKYYKLQLSNNGSGYDTGYLVSTTISMPDYMHYAIYQKVVINDVVYARSRSGYSEDTAVSSSVNWEVDSKIVVDSALSETSENPVQNKLITVPINEMKADIVSITGSRTRVNCNIGDKIPTGDLVKLVKYECGATLDGYPTVSCTNPSDGSALSISYGEVPSSSQGYTISTIQATDWNFNEIYQDTVDESRYLIFEVVNYGTIPSIEVKIQENNNAQILSKAGTHTIKCYAGNTVPSGDNITSIVFKNLVMGGETASGSIYYGDDFVFDVSGDLITHHSGELITKIAGGSNTVEIYEEDCYVVLEVTVEDSNSELEGKVASLETELTSLKGSTTTVKCYVGDTIPTGTSIIFKELHCNGETFVGADAEQYGAHIKIDEMGTSYSSISAFQGGIITYMSNMYGSDCTSHDDNWYVVLEVEVEGVIPALEARIAALEAVIANIQNAEEASF